VTAAGSSPRSTPTVCPFVALAEDRDRRADTPDERNRCYAERAPRRRDLAYQAEYCYSASFAACSIFLAWAARNAAEPAYVTDAARAAWASGIAAPEGRTGDDPTASRFAWGAPETDAEPIQPGGPVIDGGLFGPADPDEAHAGAGTDEHDWVSASAWAAAPWDPLAEAEAAELEALAVAADEIAVEEVGEPVEPAGTDEALQGPKVPAALPLRRRQRDQTPIMSRGSGEWLYSDPIERQPLMSRRRGGIGAPILLVVLGLLVVSIFVFLVPALLGGGTAPAAVASPTPGASRRPAASHAPSRTFEPSPSPSLPAEPDSRVYTVKPGNTLSFIADRFDVSQRHLQCLNVITNPNLIQPGQKLLIPPEGFSCPAGWRNMTPPPIPEG
jgi:nucleoid-associated protein YgaU